MEIDVWDGEPEDESGEDSSSESSSDDEGKSPQKKEKQEKKKAKKETTTRRSRINNAVSSKVEGVSSKVEGILGRKSEVPNEPKTHDASNSEEPATQEPAVRVPSHPEPMVLHGHTLTKGTTFRDVCNAIRDSAFVTSDLPVIVSLEVHACLQQQQTMVEIMQEAWKGLLIDITPELLASPNTPTLEDLKKKILIKVKWVQHLDDNHAEAESAEELQSLEARRQRAQNGSAGNAPPKPSKILEALSRLAVYTKGFSFRHMDQPGMNHHLVVYGHMINFVYLTQRPRSPGTCSRYRKAPPRKSTSTTAKPSSNTTGASSCGCTRMDYV